MIKLDYAESKAICDWYVNAMLRVIPQRKPESLLTKENVYLKKIIRDVCAMDELQIKDILILPREILAEKYPEIKAYDSLCCFTGYYSYYKTDIRNKYPHRISEQKAFRHSYLEALSDHMIGFILNKSGVSPSREQIISGWKSFDDFVDRAAKLLNDINEILSARIDYGYMPDTIRCALVKKMDVNVCPYCNRMYIQPIVVDGHNRYTGDLDHFLPKSVFQLYSLSVWNLVPSCKLCNQSFKGKRLIPLRNPVKKGFENDCFISLEYHDVNAILGNNSHFDICWETDAFVSESEQEVLRNNIELFKLNEVYQYHKEDFRLMLKRRQMLSDERYLAAVKKLLGTDDGESIWMGVSPEPCKDQLMAKAKEDIVVHN